MTSYDGTVTREDNLWVAFVDNVGATDVEHFPDLDVELRDYIAGMTDADPGDFAISFALRSQRPRRYGCPDTLHGRRARTP
jgi:hypothetical protein